MPSTPEPRITIVTPSFQQARFLPWTIRSVTAQDYADLEYIVIDGGSTDGSREIIESHAKRLAWWCSERDGGQTQAINKGFRRATGEIVGWLNSDDMLLPGCLRTVASAFKDPSVEAICGWGVMMSEQGRVRRRWVHAQPTARMLCSESLLFQPAVFWRRRLHDAFGFLDESFRFTMDREWFARLAAGGVVPRLLPRCLAAYRAHAATKTSMFGDVGALESERVLALHGKSQSGSDRVSWDWRARNRAWKLMLEKAGQVLPPWWRGRDVHRTVALVSGSTT
ncbi:MAG: glycosyltransferase [Planctomycetes bacterium]|nr:glycosyltransferase [Planctomycetota bacterium]